MAITKRVRILVRAHADGVATSFTFNLLTDPYWVGEPAPQGPGGHLVNWFADPDVKKGAPPVDVMVIDGAGSATLAGTVVTVTVDPKPSGMLYEVTLGLVFA